MKPESALYIVATPIGNLDDMTPRAIEVLQSVDLIAAEDTRHSAKLMQHCSVQTPLIAYHDHSSDDQVERILHRLREGKSVALISDAGTPLISDPGYRLVARAREESITVIPIPGACALIAAMCASGLPTDRFMFEGFTPAKSSGRKKLFEQVKQEERTVICYESPHRLEDSLKDAIEVLGGDRKVVLARELTKTFETFLCGPLQEVLDTVLSDANQKKGEMIILIQGCSPEPASDSISAEVERTMNVLLEELPIKQASALASKLTGEKKNKLYKWALAKQA